MAVKTETVYSFPRSISMEELENVLMSFRDQHADTPAEVLLPSQFDNDPLAEAWIALTTGSLFREIPDIKVKTWGHKNLKTFSREKFCTTLPGLTALGLSEKVITQNGKDEIDLNALRRWIEVDQGGTPKSTEMKSGQALIVEFDNRRAHKFDALSSRGQRPSEDVFRQVLLELRRKVEFWHSPSSNHVTQLGYRDTLSDLAEFLKEIFENSFRHGMYPDSTQNSVPRQLRYIRIRRLIDSRDGGLENRARKVHEALGDHIKKTMESKNYNVERNLIEVTISDFGLGIVDHFLEHAADRNLDYKQRAELLNRLLHDQLSSNSFDPAAGLGIRNALTAAVRAKAFVSVRTNEFWMGRSYANRPTKSAKLRHLSKSPLGKAVGTHWQFIWSPNL